MVFRGSLEWERLYARRQMIERLFGSLKRSRLLDRHQYVRRDKVELHLELSILAYTTTMLTRPDARDGERLGHIRSKVKA